MKKKFILPMIVISSLLSSCTLFNDDDIRVTNSYNPFIEEISTDPSAPKAQGVTGKTVEATPNALCFKNISYAKENTIENTYKVGGKNHSEYNVNGGEDYYGNQGSNNYDLYVPNSLDKSAKHNVILFIHGGAWVSGLKTDVNSYVHEFANRGYITATIKYTLLNRAMNDSSLSIFRNLDEIDACITSIKAALTDLGFDTTKTNLVLGGASSGSHLAMLYTYSRGKDAALPIKFLVDAVGPVDILPDNWKKFNSASEAVLDAGITYSAIEAQRLASNLGELPIMGEGANWCEYQTVRIANGMCGIPYTLGQIEASTNASKHDIVYPNDASTSMTKPGGGRDLLSVTHYMSATNKFPMICAYAGRDSIVGIAQYAKLEQMMNLYGIDHELFYFKNSDHTEISEAKDPTTYTAFLTAIDNKLKSL